MKWLTSSILAIACFLTPAVISFAESSGTDPFGEYQQFLKQHRDTSTPELLAMHPAGDFQEDVGLPWESILHHELIDAQYSLTPYEKTLLERNGFVVTERLRQSSFLEHLLEIWKDDLPLFISTDALLHAVHFYYGMMLSDIESGVLCDRLATLLSKMHAQVPTLSAKYSDEANLRLMIEDVDLYLTVARRLLGEGSVTPHVVGSAAVNEVLNLIQAETLATYPLFSQACREIDFSQFIPRGHYTDKWYDLEDYFRAMMWLGRTEMYLLAPQNVADWPCPRQSPEAIQRQTIDAVMVLELMDLADVNQLYAEIESIVSLLVGEQDNVTVAQLRHVLEAAEIDDAEQLLDPAKLETFQQLLKAESFASQRILSQVLRHDPMTPEAVQPAAAFMLFGQRFVIDSYITGNVVYDRITYRNQPVCRLFPSALDVLAGLGNNVAIELLVPELDTYFYAANLAALRYLVDGHDAAFWDGSIYNMWLNAIRTLSPPANRENLPVFMQTAAWWHEKMNTQLASWIELRHDNLLYAKQSYTAGDLCSYPCAYVEPFPEFFQCLNRLAVTAYARFANRTFSGDAWGGYYLLHWYEVLRDVSETLGTIARKELEGVPLTEQEITFMKQMLYRDSYGTLDGWYMELLYAEPIATKPSVSADYVVADYHTTPTDCAGNVIGVVSHAGTGPVDLAIITAKAPGAETAAFVGPVMSYYEYSTTGFQRLTDEEWESTYLSQAKRPVWVSSYLANEAGEPYEQQ